VTELYYTWRWIIIAEKELKVFQQSDYWTFQSAIDQFENPNLEIKLGGIYTLERISTESDEDYWPIMEILKTYVRKN